jgi:UDP-N-acetylglucosamine--N-acetylmuramyl-(pentapeptide) pyrophosphoryl-undecaprenol N-acetylglucosamine transferase
MPSRAKTETIVLTGGGTGGHVFPLVAVADALSAMAAHVRLVFVGTERGIETQVVPARGYELRLVNIEPIRGRGVWGGVRGVGRATASIPEGVSLLRDLDPCVVFSIGGYAAGSISLAAKLLRIPLALMEPNAVVGLANRLVAPFVTRAYTSLVEAERHFPKRAVLRTGLAIRRGFDAREYTYDKRELEVLVLGGSQGAKALNENIPAALAACSGSIRVVHQSGKGRDEGVRETYRRLGVTFSTEVVPFIQDMPSALAKADLVVGRSGAGAVAELCAVGRPGLFIPYPFASGDHQYHNAMSVVRSGGAVCVRNDEATAERLQHEIESLRQDPETLPRMAERASRLGNPGAAKRVAEDLLALAGIAAHEPSGSGMDDDQADDEALSTTTKGVH